MRLFPIKILTCVLILCIFGCQNKPSEQVNVVRLNIGDEPQSLDPRKARHLNSLSIANMLFEGLMRKNKEGKVEPALAQNIEISADLKQYIFHLKEAYWTNGDPVTAEDFVHSWTKMLSPEFPSDRAFLLYVIKNAKAAKEGKVPLDAIGARAQDSQTLLVELENPTPYFLELVSSATFFPVNKRIDETNPAWAQEAATYVSNGPFQLSSWKHQDVLEVKKNIHYWDAAHVKLDGVKLFMLTGETELKMFEKRQLDWVGSPLSVLPLDALKSLRKIPQFKTQQGMGSDFVRFNTSFGPLTNLLIRRAFALAVNRQDIVEHVTQGNQIPATGIVPPSFGLQPTPYFKDGDVATAKQLFEQGLVQLHLTRETFPEVTYLYRMSERSHLIAQALQQQWFEAFGIRVKLEGMESKVYFERVSKQNYQLAYGGWMADFADPINFLEVFKEKNGRSNNTFWENPEYAALLDQSAQIKDASQRLEILAKCEKILMNEMPVIPLLYSNMLYLSQPDLQDVAISPMGVIDFKWAVKGER